MDPLDDLFSKDGWIITTNTNGKTKVASCNPNETDIFNETRNNWITFHESAQLTEDKENNIIGSRRVLKAPFQKIGIKSSDKRVGFYLIRDLLNFKRSNNLTEALLADNMPLNKVVICGRISSYEQKNNFYRLILDDGSSSILCMVKIRDDNNADLQDTLQDSLHDNQFEEEINTSYNRTKEPKEHNSVLWAIRKLTLQRKRMIEDSAMNFNQTSLGRPVRIFGYLREFYGKNFIFAYNFRWVSEKYFVNFLNYIIEVYEYKENYMLE